MNKKNVQSKKAFSVLIILVLVSSFFVSLNLTGNANATPIFEDGFETGNTNAWTYSEYSGATQSVTASAAHSGSNGYRITSLDTLDDYAILQKTLTKQPEFYFNAYVRFSSHFADNTRLSSLLIAETFEEWNDVVSVFLSRDTGSSSYKWGIYGSHAAGNLSLSNSFSMSPNTWYHLEFYVLDSTNWEDDGVAKLYVDDVLAVDASGIVIGNIGGYDLFKIAAGQFSTNPNAGTVDFDDISVSQTRESTSYTSNLSIVSPTNTTYTNSFTVSLSDSGNDDNKVFTYNIAFSNGTTIANTTWTTPVTLTLSSNVTATLNAYVTADHSSDSAQVMFTGQVSDSYTNYAPMPTGWTTDYTGMSLGIGGVSNVVLDSSVTYNGQSTLRLDPIGATVNTNREANSYFLPINVGDNITFSVWIKMSAAAGGETDRGARFGLDFYGANGRIVGAQTPDGGTWSPDGWPDNEDDQFVSWGTTTWTKKTMSFIVNDTYSADYWANPAYSLGQAVVPTGCIPWLQACSSVDGGQAWFAETEFYINSASDAGTDTYTATLQINNPTNTTFTSSVVPINITASTNASNPVVNYHFVFSNGTSTANATYTTPTSIIINSNITGTMYAYLETTEGANDTAQVSFTVQITDTYTVNITINNPVNSTYTTSTIPIVLLASSNASITEINYNIAFSNGTTTSNFTYTGATSITVNSNVTGTLTAYIETEEGVSDTDTVGFTVTVTTGTPTPTATPAPTATPTAPPIIITGETQDLYFRSDTYTTLNETAYGLDTDYTNTASTSNTRTSIDLIQYGFKVYLFSANSETQLTSGYSGIITLTNTSTGGYYSGFKHGYWNIAKTNVILGYQALKVEVYSYTPTSLWTLEKTYISPVLITKEIVASTLDFKLYVTVNFTTPSTMGGSADVTSFFSFGDPTHKSGVFGLQVVTPKQSEVQLWRVNSGDYIGFEIGAYVDVIGEAFYVLLIVLCGGILYFRYGHFGVIAFAFTLSGVMGGVLWVFIPAWAAAVACALILLGTTFMVWRVIR